MLISSFHPPKILILLLASCFIWIGGISLAMVFFMGTSVTTGWIIAGCLVMALAVWVLVMAREIRDAVVLPDHFAADQVEADPVRQSGNPAFESSCPEMKKAPVERPVMDGRRIALRFRSQTRSEIGLPRKPAAGR